MILSHTPSSLSSHNWAFKFMHLKACQMILLGRSTSISNTTRPWMNSTFFLSSLANMFLLTSSSSQIMASPSTQPQQPKSWASPTPGHPCSISGCTLPCTWQKFHSSTLSLHVSHHCSENSLSFTCKRERFIDFLSWSCNSLLTYLLGRKYVEF